MKLTPMGIQVSEDKLVATISRINPDNTFEEIIALIKKNKICVGIDNEGIRAALAKARSGQIQYEAIVAKGSPPTVAKESEIIHHLPEELTAAKQNAADELPAAFTTSHSAR